MANITGTIGDDVLIGTAAIDTIDGLDGNDVLSGLAGNDSLNGGDGDDSLKGGAGADSQQGGNGNDLFLIGSVAEFAAGESIDGGADTDILRYTGSTAATLTLTNSVTNLEQVQIANAAGIITGRAAVNVNAGAVGNALTLIGNNGANRLIGTAFNDTLTGNGGNDRLDGGAGDDHMAGGAGNDTYVVDSGLDIITETLAGGVDRVESAITFSLVGTNLEQLTLTGAADLDGTGNTLNNRLTGNGGDNVLDGGGGADQMAGGGGNDAYVVDSTSDVVTEALNAGNDTVSASVSYTLRANVENLTLTGGANLNGTGNSGNNSLTGNNGNNVLAGLAGADTLTGGDGDDTLDGGAGIDSMTGGKGMICTCSIPPPTACTKLWEKGPTRCD